MTSIRPIPARFTALGLAVAIVVVAAPFMPAQTLPAPIAIESARITLAGTSNVHDYTASTSNARITRVTVASADAASWDALQTPGGLTAFDLAIAAGSLTSPRDGVDKNMHKALKVKEHADITFSLKRIEGSPGALTAVGTLRVAGVSRDVTLPLKTSAQGAHLLVTGALDVLMPDFGIEPPRAMLGMVRANPKVTVTFEVVLAGGTT